MADPKPGSSRKVSTSLERGPEMPPSPVESPAAYAKEAKEAYDQLPDSPETPSGKTLSVLSSTLRGVWDAFTKAKPFEKALIATGAVAVSAVTVYAGVKILEKGISLVKGTVDKLFSLGDKAQEEVAAVKEKSHERLIWTLLGTAAAGGLLYLLVAKVDLVDLFREAKNHPDGFVKGFLVAVTTRIVTGVLDEPGAWWDDLAEKWGLPNREELKQQRASRGKTLAKAAREKLSEAVDMVSEFDEKSGLKVLRERTFKSLDNRFPGWQENDTMKAIHALKDPSQVMNWLDLNTPEKRAAFYAEASVKAAEGVGVGIGSYLLMKLFSTPYSGLISGLNMGLYFVLQQEGVSTSVVHGIETLEESVNAAHGEVKKIFNHLGLKPEWLGLQDEGWGLKSALDFVLNMAKDHPGFAVLAVLDGAILSRKLIAAVVVGSIEFMFKASGATAQFIMEHKTASGILLGVGALTVIERRQVIADLAQLLHPDSSEQRRAFIDDMTRYLNASKILALPKEPEFKEAALLPFYEGLVKNPVAFLSNPERRFQLFKFVEAGNIDICWDGVGNWLLAFSAITPVGASVSLGEGTFDAIFAEWEARGVRADNLHVYATYAGELVITGAALKGVAKGYIALWSDFNGGAGGLGRLLKSFIPLSKESRFLWRSAAHDVGNAITVGQWTPLRQGYHISQFTVEIAKFIKLSEGITSASTPEAIKALAQDIEVYSSNIAQKLQSLEGEARLFGFQDMKLIRELRQLRTQMNSLVEKANNKALHFDEINNLRDSLAQISRRIQTHWSRAFLKSARIKNADIFGRYDLEGPPPIVQGRAITPAELARLNPAFRPQFEALAQRGVSAQAIDGLAKTPGLDASDLDDLVKAYQANPIEVAKLNELAFSGKYGSALSYLSRAKEYGLKPAVALLLLCGFAVANDKAAFISTTVLGLAGYEGGFRAALAADRFLGNKLHPLARGVMAVLVGFGAAIGAGKLFDDAVIARLDKVWPNRNSDDSWLNYIAHSLYITGAGHAVDAALTLNPIAMNVNAKTDPLDYLSAAMPSTTGTKEVRMRFEEDLVENAHEKIERYEKESEELFVEWKGLDPSSKRALQIEADVEEHRNDIARLKTFEDGTWVEAARIELALMSREIQPLQREFSKLADEKFPGRFGDQGSSFVNSLVARIGTGQDLVDDEDMSIWHYFIAEKPTIQLPDSEREFTFRDFVAFVTYVKDREKKLRALGHEPLSIEPETPGESPTSPVIS